MLNKGASHLNPGDVVLGWVRPSGARSAVREMATGLTVATVREQKSLEDDKLIGHYVGWQVGPAVVWSDLHPLTDRALYVPAESIPAPEPMPEFACSECGRTDKQTYIVNTLDPEDPKGTRTEACRDCDDFMRATEAEGMPALVYGEQATDSWLDLVATMKGWNATVTLTDGVTIDGALDGAGYGIGGMASIYLTPADGIPLAYTTEDVRQVLIH